MCVILLIVNLFNRLIAGFNYIEIEDSTIVNTSYFSRQQSACLVLADG